ncbi:hypothetical protein EV421DRAFT_1506022 [Armillaria borealis]|uniref:Uncharacterized protein n=1 Tax=Armillaria borealis TaxID=47425 RepID=A0AA39MFT8_9AGAR|nr:hypothetical protein EV421DRAFT_1506022 [Armillaria borealis]
MLTANDVSTVFIVLHSFNLSWAIISRAPIEPLEDVSIQCCMNTYHAAAMHAPSLFLLALLRTACLVDKHGYSTSTAMSAVLINHVLTYFKIIYFVQAPTRSYSDLSAPQR